MAKREEKKNEIIAQAIEILKTEGVTGLTMRGLASASGMTLSNLQYYFPGRTEVLQATIQYFFAWCQQNVLLERERIKEASKDPQSDFVDVLLELLIVSDPKDPNNIIFKEICALAVHEQLLAKTFEEYYKEYIRSLTIIASGVMPNAEKIICLLIPYAEGYSLTGTSLPVDRSEVVRTLKEIIGRLMDEGEAK